MTTPAPLTPAQQCMGHGMPCTACSQCLCYAGEQMMQASGRFELPLLDSKSRVIATTLRGHNICCWTRWCNCRNLDTVLACFTHSAVPLAALLSHSLCRVAGAAASPDSNYLLVLWLSRPFILLLTVCSMLTDLCCLLPRHTFLVQGCRLT